MGTSRFNRPMLRRHRAGGEGDEDGNPPSPSPGPCTLDTTVVLDVDTRFDPTATVVAAIAHLHAEVGDMVTLRSDGAHAVRRIALRTQDDELTSSVLSAIRAIPGVAIQNVSDAAIDRHKGGKIKQTSRVALHTAEDLRHIYTPGVARVATAIRNRPARALELHLASTAPRRGLVSLFGRRLPVRVFRRLAARDGKPRRRYCRWLAGRHSGRLCHSHHP